MYCKYCGKQIADKAVFCVNCGTFLKDVRPVTVSRGQFNGKKIQPPKKTNGLSLAGFILSVVSIALAVLFVYINVYQYTGVYLQFYCVIPLAVALGLSIAGTVKAKKTKSGTGFGIAGIVISGGIFVGAILHFIIVALLKFIGVIILICLMILL